MTRAKPVGIAASQLSEAQRAQLVKLIEVYARTFERSLADARMARVREGGVENLRFGWAGRPPRPPHYYRVQGPRFLIEYDASQDGGNHIHTVWRDFNGDFGRELPAKGAFGRDLLLRPLCVIARDAAPARSKQAARPEEFVVSSLAPRCTSMYYLGSRCGPSRPGPFAAVLSQV